MMDRGTKVMVTVAAAAVLILLGLAAYGYLTGAWEVPP
jgi:hypothetical protein